MSLKIRMKINYWELCKAEANFHEIREIKNDFPKSDSRQKKILKVISKPHKRLKAKHEKLLAMVGVADEWFTVA